MYNLLTPGSSPGGWTRSFLSLTFYIKYATLSAEFAVEPYLKEVQDEQDADSYTSGFSV